MTIKTWLLVLLLGAHGVVHADRFAFSYVFDNVLTATDVSRLTGIFEGTANGDLINITKLVYLQAGIYTFNDIGAVGVTSFSGSTQSLSINGDSGDPRFIFAFDAYAAPGQSEPGRIDFVGVERLRNWGDAHDSPINPSWSLTALTATVPEPGAGWMLAAGLGAIGVWARKKKATV